MNLQSKSEIANEAHKKMAEALSAQREKVRKAEFVNRDGVRMCGICNKPLEKHHDKDGKKIAFSIPLECDCTRNLIGDVEKAQKEAFRQNEIAEKRRKAFYDSRLETWCFENGDRKNEKLLNAARTYAENFEKLEEENCGLLLYGGNGTGKTFAAACIVNELLERNIPCLFTSMSRLANDLFDSKSKNELLDSLKRYRLLVIDDLGIERETGYIREAAYNVINARYISGKPLIVTSNITGDELKNREDRAKARILDRILEICHPMEVQGNSRRAEALKESFTRRNKFFGLS